LMDSFRRVRGRLCVPACAPPRRCLQFLGVLLCLGGPPVATTKNAPKPNLDHVGSPNMIVARTLARASHGPSSTRPLCRAFRTARRVCCRSGPPVISQGPGRKTIMRALGTSPASDRSSKEQIAVAGARLAHGSEASAPVRSRVLCAGEILRAETETPSPG